MMVEGSQNPLMKFPTMLKIDIGGDLFTRSKRSQPPTKSTLKLQIDGMLHSIEATDQCSIQHHQRSSIYQTPEVNPAQSLTF